MVDSKRLIEDTRRGLSTTEEELRIFEQTRDELNRQLRNARRRLARKETGTAYADKFVKQAIEDVKQEAPFILMQAMDDAINRSTEFTLPIYKQLLFTAAKERSIYKIIPRGSGFATQITVAIVLESVAGTLYDYARGINIYREETLRTKIGISEDSGYKATNHWLTKVYANSGLQTKTVKGRVAASGRQAPFWQLLNSGSSPMESDRPDGSYNPFPQEPTDFIGNAERSIRIQYTSIVGPEYALWLQEIQELNNFIRDTVRTRDNTTDLIFKLKAEVRENARQNQEIFDSFRELKRFVDEGKVDAAMKRYRAGEEFERVLVSKQGAGRRVYLTARRIEGYL